MNDKICAELDRLFELEFADMVHTPVMANVIFLEDGFNVEHLGVEHGKVQLVNRTYKNGDPYLKSILGKAVIESILTGKTNFKDAVKFLIQNLVRSSITNLTDGKILKRDTEILLTFYRKDNTIFKLSPRGDYELEINLKFRR